jgi:hypothetical protein
LEKDLDFRKEGQSLTCFKSGHAIWGRRKTRHKHHFDRMACIEFATYLNCDDGADAREANAERPGNEREEEL